MPTLPDNSINLVYGVQFQRQPSLTWKIDKESQRIIGMVQGLEAVRQAVEIILNTERFRWQIYQPYSGMMWNGLIGQDPGYVSSELQRRIKDALLMDDRVTGISDFQYTVNNSNILSASLTVNTVYGDTQTTIEVTLT